MLCCSQPVKPPMHITPAATPFRVLYLHRNSKPVIPVTPAAAAKQYILPSARYPFTAPAVIPSTKLLWKILYTISIGIVQIVTPAAVRFSSSYHITARLQLCLRITLQNNSRLQSPLQMLSASAPYSFPRRSYPQSAAVRSSSLRRSPWAA